MISQLVKTESNYESAFRQLQDRPVNRATWIKLLRESAMDSFEQLGIPSVAEEEWKYTNLVSLSKVNFEPVVSSDKTQITSGDLKLFSYPEAASTQLVLINGILRRELSSFEGLEGIVALELSAAAADKKYGEVVREYLARVADSNANGLTALNTAFISSGAFVFIPQNAKLEAPVHILCFSDAAHPDSANFPRVLIVSEKNSSAKIIESYAGSRGQQYFTNAVVEVVLAEGARLEHYRVQRESREAFHVATTTVTLGPHSTYDATALTAGGKVSRHNINVEMNHEGAECWVDGLYVVSTGQHADTHSVIDHKQPHCTSRQLYKGILDGKSRAVFNGKIFVRPGAQKTDAMQTNKNLLLSHDARVDTKPQLEIFADDVKCAHGAAVGQLDEDALFYLASRGIHSLLARNLLTYGFAEEVIEKIKVESLRARLDEMVLNRLQARLEV